MSEKTPIEKISDVINDIMDHTVSAIAKIYYVQNPDGKPTYRWLCSCPSKHR